MGGDRILKECYFATVYHTGTKYFKRTLEKKYRISYSHYNKSVLNQLPNYDIIYTTYRDPYRVAASWGNRNRFQKKSPQFDRWEEQWTCYREALKFNPIILDFTKGSIQNNIDFGLEPVNQHGDDKKLHEAIDVGNLDYLYEFIPKELVDYAVECCEGALCQKEQM